MLRLSVARTWDLPGPGPGSRTWDPTGSGFQKVRFLSAGPKGSDPGPGPGPGPGQVLNWKLTGPCNTAATIQLWNRKPPRTVLDDA